MYSSPLTGLNIQYDNRTCEDDDNWVSTLDNSVRCSSLSPTDERCHHYDVNGDSGYDSCPKACGNCFEEAPRSSEDSDDSMGSQPMGLYTGESGETNEFDPLGSNSRGRGDLEDLIYKFTYDINDKINELSEKIDDYKDNTDSRIEVNEESNRGVCYKQVCRNKESTDTTRPTTCTGNEMCRDYRYSECELDSCCKIPDDVSPDYYMADENEMSEGCDKEDYKYYDISRDVADDDIQLFQERLISGVSQSGSPDTSGGGNTGEDFIVTIKGGDDNGLTLGNYTKKGNITYIPLSSSTENKIKDFTINTGQHFLYEKNVSYAMFNIIDDNTTGFKSGNWTKYNFNQPNRTEEIGTHDYLVIKLTSYDKQNNGMCLNDDFNTDVKNCNIFDDKDAKYYVYLFSGSYTDVDSETNINYGSFYFAVKDPNDDSQISLSKIPMVGDPSINYNDNGNRKTTSEYIGQNILGLYFQYNTENIFYTDSSGENPPSIRSKPLNATIEYPLEDGDSEMKQITIDVNDIFSQNQIESPSPFLYKIHNFDKDEHNINLAEVNIKIENTPNVFFMKDYNGECESSWVKGTWWSSIILIGLMMFIVYASYSSFSKYKSNDGIVLALLTLITFSIIIIIPLFGKKWRAYLKSLIYLIIYLLSFVIYSNLGKQNMEIYSIFSMNILQLLFIVYLINITTYTDYLNKFINPEENDCDLSIAYPILYFVLIFSVVLIQGIYMLFNKYPYPRKGIFLVIAMIVHYLSSNIDSSDDNKMVKHIYEWFGYDTDSSGWSALLKLIRDILIIL